MEKALGPRWQDSDRGVSFTCLPGPWPHTPVPAAGTEAPAVAGAEIQGALRLRVEGTAAQRLRGGQDLPHSGIIRLAPFQNVTARPTPISSSPKARGLNCRSLNVPRAVLFEE